MRDETKNLLIALLIIILFVGGFLWLITAMEPVEGSDRADEGTWIQVRPPPRAPDGVECWVWVDGVLDNRYGGATCFDPEN